MNEAIFFLHIALAMAFTFGALRLGKEALIASACLQAVFANLFVLKQIDVFHLTITCSDVYAVGGILSLNLLQEYFGKVSAQYAAKGSLFFLVFFAAMAKLHLLYEPSTIDTTHSAYSAILSSAPRILIASLATFYLSQRLDIFLFSLAKQKMPKTPLVVRNVLTMLSSQGFDTLLFSFLGLYGLIGSIFDVILVSLLIKFSVILLSAPLTALSKKFLAKTQPNS